MFTCSYAQVYYKIPTDTNLYWRQFSLCLSSSNWIDRYDYQIRYYKDTIINSKTYNLYERFGRSWGYEFCPSFTKRGFLRQDTLAKKVFILDANFIERPLYNFSKQIGDTLLHYNKSLNSVVTLTVQYLDTAYFYDGSKHKAQWVSNNNCFIEGVGSIFGGLYGDDQMMNTPNNISEQLLCYGRITPFFEIMEGITQQIYYCSLVPATVGINGLKGLEKYEINVFPNPAQDKVTVKFENTPSIGTHITLSNTLGQIIYTHNAPNPMLEINLTTFSSGIYYLKVQDKSGFQTTFKVIKE